MPIPDVTPYPPRVYLVAMSDKTETAYSLLPRMKFTWQKYRSLARQLDRTRAELDGLIESVLADTELRQVDLADFLGCTRQDIQESRRRHQRRKEGETP